MLVQILTENNAFTFLTWLIIALGGILMVICGYFIDKLIKNLSELNKTVRTNNIYQKQHFDMLKDHDNRIVKLEFSNGKE